MLLIKPLAKSWDGDADRKDRHRHRHKFKLTIVLRYLTTGNSKWVVGRLCRAGCFIGSPEGPTALRDLDLMGLTPFRNPGGVNSKFQEDMGTENDATGPRREAATGTAVDLVGAR